VHRWLFKKKLVVVVFVIPTLVVTLLSFRIISGPIKTAVSFFLKPPLKLISYISPSRVSFYMQSAYSPYIKWQDEVKRLKAEIASLKEAETENQRLKNLLGFKKSAPRHAVVARVIARDYSNYRHTVVIGRGSKSGIKRRDCVISPFGLAGRVVEVMPGMSRVILLTDFDFRAACLIQRSREEGMLFGTMKGTCRMKYLPPDADVKNGDIVVTSGLGGFYPKGLMVGEVTKIMTSADELSLELYIRPATALKRLEEVLVMVEK